MVSCVADAVLTVAEMPLTVTTFSDGVAENDVPEIVTTVPILPDAGRKELIEGAGVGSWLFLHPEKSKTDSISRNDKIFEVAFSFKGVTGTRHVMV